MVEGVEEVQGRVGGSPAEVASLLAKLGAEQGDFHWDSRTMVARLGDQTKE